MNDTATLNDKWAHLIIDELTRQKVGYFCLSPGSRSTPLALAIAAHPQAKNLVHFDERGMSFHALGYAKASQTPVALLVTSGSAVGNLLPAVMEASHSFIPLILLTADRPPELIQAGANQTTDQLKIFGDFVRWHAEIPCPDSHIDERFVKTTIAQAAFRAVSPPKGVVHLNCQFREPLFADGQVGSSSTFSTEYEPTFTTLNEEVFEKWANTLSQVKKGVVLIGEMNSPFPLTPLLKLAEALNWPVFADILSCARLPSKSVIAHYDLILKAYPELLSFDAALHFGSRMVSKTISENLSASLYCHVAGHPFRHDPKHKVTARIACDPVHFAKKLLPYLSQTDRSHDWENSSCYLKEKTEEILQKETTLTEPGVFHFLKNHLPSSWNLFVGNSMPVRDADLFFFPQGKAISVYANRGLSGIDGNIATSLGMANGAKKPLVCVIGDQAALHDLNSLAQIKESKFPVIFIFINNQGGGIFSFLPIAQKTFAFEKYVAGAHTLSFSNAAALFDIPYGVAETKEEFETTLAQALKENKSFILEVVTNRKENYEFHQKISSQLIEGFKACFDTKLRAIEPALL